MYDIVYAIYNFIWWTRNTNMYARANTPVWLWECLCELICLHIFRYYTDKECTCVSTHVFLHMAELYHFLFSFLSLKFNLPSGSFIYAFFFFLAKKKGKKSFLLYKSYRIFFSGHYGKNNQPNNFMQLKTPNIKINVKETEWGRKTVLQLLSSDQHFCCSGLPEW